MASSEVIKLKMQPLDAEEFKPYGTVLDQKVPIFPEVDPGQGRVAMEIVKAKNTAYLPSTDNEPGYRLTLGRLQEIAIHYSYNQTFIPLRGTFVLVVAPAPAKIGAHEHEYPLDYSKLKAFVIEPGQAAIINKGVWHSGACLGRECTFINVTRKDPGEKPSDEFAHATMRGYIETVDFTKRDNKVIELEL